MARVESLTSFLEEARSRVNTTLARVLPTGNPAAFDSAQAKEAGPHSTDTCPPVLADALRYCVLAGGKRLRPLLVLAAAHDVSRKSASPADALTLALPAACAIELIHTYSLVHDDLPAMDNDALRRGRPTLHVLHGDGMAILVGDALQAEAFRLLAREPVSNDPVIAARKLRVIEIVAEAAGACGMVGGQAIDLQAAGQVVGQSLVLDEAGLKEMHRRKTGALIRASAVAGAVMAGADDALIDSVGGWASEAGLAFQIVDDILDVEGNAGELGKTAGKDAAGAKPTYPSVFGLEQSRTLAAECSSRAHALLADAGLGDGTLSEITDWIVKRRN